MYSAYAAELGRRWFAGKVGDPQFVIMWTALEKAGHASSAQRTAQFITDYRSIQSHRPASAQVVLDEFDPAPATSAAFALMGSVRRAPDAFERIVAEYASSVDRRVLNGGRDTMEWSTAASHTTWRRVTDVNPCEFCIMLATKSDYSSRESALVVTGNHYRKRSSHRRRTPRQPGSRYHDHCGCTAVEVIGPWEQTDAERSHEELYRSAVRLVGDRGEQAMTTAVLSAMRELSSPH